MPTILLCKKLRKKYKKNEEDIQVKQQAELNEMSGSGEALLENAKIEHQERMVVLDKEHQEKKRAIVAQYQQKLVVMREQLDASYQEQVHKNNAEINHFGQAKTLFSLPNITPKADCKLQTTEAEDNILNQLDAHKLEYYIVGECISSTMLGILPNRIDIIVNCDLAELPHHIRLHHKQCTTVNVVNIDKLYIRCERWENLPVLLGRNILRLNTLLCWNDMVFDLFNAYDDLFNPYLKINGDLNQFLEKDPCRILELIRSAVQLQKGFTKQDWHILQSHLHRINTRSSVFK